MKHWEKTLVEPTASLESAIGTMDRGGLRITLVVDETRRLLGTRLAA